IHLVQQRRKIAVLRTYFYARVVFAPLRCRRAPGGGAALKAGSDDIAPGITAQLRLASATSTQVRRGGPRAARNAAACESASNFDPRDSTLKYMKLKKNLPVTGVS